jgi:hypothetical protein
MVSLRKPPGFVRGGAEGASGQTDTERRVVLPNPQVRLAPKPRGRGRAPIRGVARGPEVDFPEWPVLASFTHGEETLRRIRDRAPRETALLGGDPDDLARGESRG